jgi:hypothetical protein
MLSIPFQGTFSMARVFFVHVSELSTRNCGGAGRGLKRFILLSYDLKRTEHRNRRRITRYLYGETVTRQANSGWRVYHYEGVVERSGGRPVGQSVVLLPPPVSAEAARRLRDLGASVETTEVWL